MDRHTATVIIISEEILSGKKDFNSYVTLPLQLVPKWNIKKLIVLPPNSQIIRYELKTAYKMCEIVIVIQEIATEGFNLWEVIANLFQEKSTAEAENELLPPFKLLRINDSNVRNLKPVVSFHRLYILRGDTPSIMSSFKNVLKPYLTDYKQKVKYKKKFEITIKEGVVEHFLNEVKSDDVLIKRDHIDGKMVITAEATLLNGITVLEEIIRKKFGSEGVTSKADNLNIFEYFYFQVDTLITDTVKVIFF